MSRRERIEALEDRRDARQGLRGDEERREDWQDYAEERRGDWQAFAEDRYEDHDDYYGGYYYDDGHDDYALPESYSYSLPCRSPLVMASGGTVYYVCHPTRYTRAYIDGEVVYVIAPQ
jgi:hypothetical protein